MIRTLVLLSLSLAPSLATAQPAQTSLVRLSDLDPAKPADVARLDSRIGAAVKAACDNGDNVFPEAAKEIVQCERDTRAVAERQIQVALLVRQVRLASR